MAITYLTAVQVLFIHARLIDETGGEHGVLDIGLLQSAVARPQASIDGSDLYPDLSLKAAAILISLIGNHPFVVGNKRTAIASAGLFLRLNGYRLQAENSQLKAFSLQCARHLLSLDEIAAWLEKHAIQE